MNFSSWFRRRLLRENGQFTSGKQSRGEKEEEILGVTDSLIEFVKSFTFETFKNFPLPGNLTLSSLWLQFHPKLDCTSHLHLCFLVVGFRFYFNVAENDCQAYLNFCSDEGEAPRVDQNLSDWQERHAVLVLSKVKVHFLLFVYK